MIEEKFSYNDINAQVFQLIEDLDSVGMKSAPRGQEVVEAMLCTLDINPKLTVMNFPQRKFNWKYFAGELAWYLDGSTSTDFIKNFSSFWENIKNPDGTVNSNYGNILFGDHPGSSYEDDSLLGEQFIHNPVNQMEWVYKSLKNDKFSRQAIAFLNCPYYQFEGNKDFVCTAYINFWIRKDHLDMKVQMRSNDIFFGLTYDAPWFSMIHQSMFLNLKKIYPELKLGMYHHCADNIHYYERHFDLVKEILDSKPENSPVFTLKEPLFTFQQRPKDQFKLSTAANKYLKSINKIVGTPTMKSMTQEDWKNKLSDLIDITD
jgi:thymidylate synthase